MRWLALILLLFLGGCGGGYVSPSAAFRLEFSSVADLEVGRRAVADALIEFGFKPVPDRPVPDFMLENASPASRWRMMNESVFIRERGGLLDHEDVRVTLTPYRDRSVAYEPYAGYRDVPHRPPFLEVHLSEGRPDGFSEATMAAHARLLDLFTPAQAGRVHLSLPVRGDDQAYFNYRLTSLLQGIAIWITAWVIFMTLIGWPASLLFDNFDWSLKVRRLALVGVGGLMATPIPVPTTLITVPLPNIMLVWMPSEYLQLLAYGGVETAMMFGVSLLLSLLAAITFVRNR